MLVKCIYCGADISPSNDICPYCGAAVTTIPSVLTTLPLGTKLYNNRYNVGKVLGQGGFGITYLGSDNLLKRRVAIKEFFPNGCTRNKTTVIPNSIPIADFNDMKEKFIEEAKILAMMNHPGIVKVYDYFEDNNTAYIVMEYLEGESLRSILNKKGKMEEKEVKEYVLKICEALKAIHEKNYLHRDLKPENVIITKDGRVVLIDFGAAREYAEGKTVSHTQILTPGYAPLEQYAKQAKRGPYTDIYALGAMMYEMLTGEVPPSAPDRVAGVGLEDISRKVNISEELREVIMKSLEIDSKMRYQTVQILLEKFTKNFKTNVFFKTEDTVSYPLVKWKISIGSCICSSPAIGKDGTIYVGSNDTYLYAISPNGTIKWKFKTNGWVDSSPAVTDDGVIYVGSEDNHLYAVNPNGTLKWKFKTGGVLHSSPAIGHDGTTYIGSNDTYLYAVNPNGTLKWSLKTGGWIDSSPSIGYDGTIYVGSMDNKLYAITSDGKLKWTFKTKDWIDSNPAIGQDGTIYIISTDNTLYAVSPSGNLKWKTFVKVYSVENVNYISPVIGSDDTIYIGDIENCMNAISPDGKIKWRYKANGWICSTAVIGFDDTIYFGGSDGYIYALDKYGTLLWKIKPDGAKGFGSSGTISPDGTLYIGDWSGNFYSIYVGTSNLANSPWPKFRGNIRNTGRFGNI